MALTLDALETIDAIERRGSFAAAADELGRVPSALTYSVRKLEEDLDVQLFDRSGHRARLTREGRALLDEGRQLMRAARDLEQRVRQLARGWPVELTLALDSLVPLDALLPLVDRFGDEQRAAIASCTKAAAQAARAAAAQPAQAARHDPECELARAGNFAPTRLRILDESLGGTRDALLTGRADIAIGLPAASEGGGELALPARSAAPLPRAFGSFETLVLGDIDWLFCVAPGHPLAALRGTLSVAEAARHRAVAVADSARVLAPRSIGILAGQDVLTVPSVPAKLAAQLAGLGCGWLPGPLARPHVAAGRLVALEHEAPRAPTTLLAGWAVPLRCKAVSLWARILGEPEARRALVGGAGAAASPPASAPAASAGIPGAAPGRRA